MNRMIVLMVMIVAVFVVRLRVVCTVHNCVPVLAISGQLFGESVVDC